MFVNEESVTWDSVGRMGLWAQQDSGSWVYLSISLFAAKVGRKNSQRNKYLDWMATDFWMSEKHLNERRLERHAFCHLLVAARRRLSSPSPSSQTHAVFPSPIRRSLHHHQWHEMVFAPSPSCHLFWGAGSFPKFPESPPDCLPRMRALRWYQSEIRQKLLQY